jgi:hypothetical protein
VVRQHLQQRRGSAGGSAIEVVAAAETASTERPAARRFQLGAGPQEDGMKREVTARTIISGFVNGQPMKGKVVASLDTGRGGRSSCEFSHLPAGFNPATFGTHT